MRHALVLAGILLILAGCDTGPGPASPPGSSASLGSPGPSAVPASPPPTEPPPTEAPTDPPPSGEPPEPDPAAFLQVCHAFDGARDEPPIPCEDAVRAALNDPGVDLASVTRVDVRSGCSDTASCPPPTPDIAHVTVLSEEAATQLEVTRADDGGLAVTAVSAGTRPPVPPFVPPPAGRAVLPDAPPGLAARQPYPLCGQEETPMGGPYDEAARTCFLTGVLAGSPVEFASVGSGTEGAQFVILYRFSGSGGIEQVFGEAGTWVRSFTGIAEADAGLVFDVDGMETAREPVP